MTDMYDSYVCESVDGATDPNMWRLPNMLHDMIYFACGSAAFYMIYLMVGLPSLGLARCHVREGDCHV